MGPVSKDKSLQYMTCISRGFIECRKYVALSRGLSSLRGVWTFTPVFGRYLEFLKCGILFLGLLDSSVGDLCLGFVESLEYRIRVWGFVKPQKGEICVWRFTNSL